ncbi:MAG: NUDIX domain-containing protein [Brachybacterium tyrofermentans]
MPHHVVAGALVGPQGVLLVHRHPDRKYYPGCWDFPGGHIELGESAADALARELREEIGVDATITGAPALRVVENEGADDGLVLQLWFVTEWEGEPTNLATDEHDELRWVAVRDVSALDLAHPSYLMFLTEWADGIGANVPPPASTPGPRPGRITP